MRGCRRGAVMRVRDPSQHNQHANLKRSQVMTNEVLDKTQQRPMEFDELGIVEITLPELLEMVVAGTNKQKCSHDFICCL